MVAVTEKLPHRSDGTVDLDRWFAQIKQQHSLTNIDLIKSSACFAEASCKGLTTFYGQPCLEQALHIAELILALKLDEEAVATAILSTITTNTSISTDALKKIFSEKIMKLLDGIHQMKVIDNLSPNTNKNRNEIQIDRIRKTLLAMASDIRVVLIKLCEQTILMRGIKHINALEKKKIATETLDIYAPLANRLGIGQLKWELEDLAFRYIDPDKYSMIAKYLAEKRADRQSRINEVIQRLSSELNNVNIKSDISGRAKHIYSIFLKMQNKHLDYKNIYDTSAVRILVATVEECYHVLSLAHHLWEHLPDEFDDYIAKPKPNGYRSIHTAIYGPDNKMLEIQIRTHAMHNEAEHGIAAHWIYKENRAKQTGYEEKIKYLRELLSWQKDIINKGTTPIALVNENDDDRVYIFTPENDIIDLPQGATPIDAAYQIHTNLGHRCRGAKINGHIVPLTHPLRTGDRIEIMSIPNGTPSRDWLNKDHGYIKTSRARSKITQWFRQQEMDHYIEDGKHILEREFAKAGLQHVDLQKLATKFQFKSIQSFLSTVGHGSIRSSQIIHAVQLDKQKAHEKSKTIIKEKKHYPSQKEGQQIIGANDLLTRLARCCKPIPGDDIIGYITQGRGVSIHRSDCKNVTAPSLEKDKRILRVDWNEQHSGGFYVELTVYAEGNQQALKEITSILSNTKVNLTSMNSTINKNTGLLFMLITVHVTSKEQLAKLIHDIKQLPFVNAIKRTQG